MANSFSACLYLVTNLYLWHCKGKGLFTPSKKKVNLKSTRVNRKRNSRWRRRARRQRIRSKCTSSKMILHLVMKKNKSKSISRSSCESYKKILMEKRNINLMIRRKKNLSCCQSSWIRCLSKETNTIAKCV